MKQLQPFLAVLLALGILCFVDKLMLPDVKSALAGDDRSFIRLLEFGVVGTIIGGHILKEVFSKSRKSGQREGLNLRDITLVLSGIGGSGAIYIALIKLL
ncbi:MAG: hypothetical protein QOG67_162 [Verrucomicrobiota bacterium]|jgi:hypothetical protein